MWCNKVSDLKNWRRKILWGKSFYNVEQNCSEKNSNQFLWLTLFSDEQIKKKVMKFCLGWKKSCDEKDL